jgi:hypothetical protein
MIPPSLELSEVLLPLNRQRLTVTVLVSPAIKSPLPAVITYSRLFDVMR